MDEYKDQIENISERFGNDADTKIQIAEIAIPNLDIVLEVGRRELFSTFVPSHRRAAAKLIELFMGQYQNKNNIFKNTFFIF